MKINVAKSAGFCFGVKRALTIALNAASQNENVYMLGDIVHNERVMKELERSGIRKLKSLTAAKNKNLLIRAHGSSRDTFSKAKELGYTIIDATCPMVKAIHRIATDTEQKGYAIIIIGDSKHDEVRGIAGQLRGKALVVENLKSITRARLNKINKAAVVVQSTQNLDKVLAIVKVIRSYVKEVKFFNTICGPTRQKQEEVKTMPKKNDLMIIVGSKNSANTKRLYELSRSLNPRSYWITAQEEIKPKWFVGKDSVGITAGASTPESTVQEIIQRISRMTRSSK